MREADLPALLDAMAAAIALPVPEESRPAVLANLARLQALAAEIMAFPMSSESEVLDRRADDIA